MGAVPSICWKFSLNIVNKKPTHKRKSFVTSRIIWESNNILVTRSLLISLAVTIHHSAGIHPSHPPDPPNPSGFLFGDASFWDSKIVIRPLWGWNWIWIHAHFRSPRWFWCFADHWSPCDLSVLRHLCVAKCPSGLFVRNCSCSYFHTTTCKKRWHALSHHFAPKGTNQ